MAYLVHGYSANIFLLTPLCEMEGELGIISVTDNFTKD